MRIELDIKNPRSNTNEYHGNITIEMDRKFAYIKNQNKDIIVDAEELFKAINALYRGDKN